ncbi:MAG: response regulator [Planctomycetes bacterium]|nr:response regulator [Planctomycetota bacterium]
MQPRVLLIDDDEVILEVQVALLKDAGVVVETYRDPVEALACIRRGGVGLVVTDLEMPKLDGLELLYRVQELPNPPRIIVLSAHDKPLRSLRQSSGRFSSSKVVKDLTASIFAILGKPFDVDEYRRLIQEALKSAPTQGPGP